MKKILPGIFFILLSFFCIPHMVFSQKFDSLLTVAQTKPDTASLNSLLQEIKLTSDSRPDSALQLIELVQPIFQKFDDLILKGKLTLRKAQVLSKLGKYDEALELTIPAEYLYTKIGYKEGIARVNHTKGMANFYKGEFQKSLNYFIQSEQLFLELGNKNEALKSQQAQGSVFLQIGNLGMGIKVLKKAEKTALELNDTSSLLYIWSNLGSAYNMNNEFENAIYYYKIVLQESHQRNITYLEMSAASNLGSVYWSMEALDQAIQYNTIALNLNNLLGDKNTRVSILVNLASAYASKKNYTKGMVYIDEAIEIIDQGESNNSDQVYKAKADILFAMGSSKEAYTWLEKHEFLKDSVANANNKEQMAQMEMQYNELKNEQTINSLNSDKLIKDQKLALSKSNTKLFIAVSIAIGFILLISLIALINNFYKNKLLKNKNKQIEESLREKEILLLEVHHRVKNNLQMIYSILNLQTKNLSGDAAEILNESKDRVKSISLIHEKLYKNEDILNIDLNALLYEIGENIRITSQYGHHTSIKTECDNIKPEMDTLIAIGIMVNELVTNCFKYAFKSDAMHQINIQLKIDEKENMVLKVVDNGHGFPPEFDMNHPTSFGFKMIKTLCKKLKGEIFCSNNHGAEVKIVLSKYKLAVA
jgi:two-component sensor histidine kinase